jgi:hypothetical protein
MAERSPRRRSRWQLPPVQPWEGTAMLVLLAFVFVMVVAALFLL